MNPITIREMLSIWSTATQMKTKHKKFPYTFCRNSSFIMGSNELEQISIFEKVRSLPLIGDTYKLVGIKILYHPQPTVANPHPETVEIYDLHFTKPPVLDEDIDWDGTNYPNSMFDFRKPKTFSELNLKHLKVKNHY